MTLAAPVDVSLLICRRATRYDLPHVLQFLAGDVLGKNREGTASHEGSKRVLDTYSNI